MSTHTATLKGKPANGRGHWLIVRLRVYVLAAFIPAVLFLIGSAIYAVWSPHPISDPVPRASPSEPGPPRRAPRIDIRRELLAKITPGALIYGVTRDKPIGIISGLVGGRDNPSSIIVIVGNENVEVPIELLEPEEFRGAPVITVTQDQLIVAVENPDRPVRLFLHMKNEKGDVIPISVELKAVKKAPGK